MSSDVILTYNKLTVYFFKSSLSHCLLDRAIYVLCFRIPVKGTE